MNNTSFLNEIRRGEERLSRGSIEMSIYHFNMAERNSVNQDQTTEAKQMSGVAFRKQGNLIMAERYGRAALELALDSQKPSLISGAARDLASTLHNMGVCVDEGRASNLREALSLYDLSLEQDAVTRRRLLQEDEEPGDRHAVTDGMKALLLYDMAHFRIWINDDGSEPGQLHKHEALAEQRRAIEKLRAAHRQLRRSHNREWELNTLLKLIQVAPLRERLNLRGRALELIALYPERKKEVLGSLLGRKAVYSALAAKARRKSKSL